MPLNCPIHRLDYNDCLDCHKLHDNECWAIPHEKRHLGSILTLEERIAILEDRPQIPEVNIVTITKQELQNWQRTLLVLQGRLDKHLAQSPKKKSRYD